MMIISFRLFWNPTTWKWTLVEDVADASGCETTIIAEHHELYPSQPFRAPKQWAAEVIGCDVAQLVGVLDDYYLRPFTWHVTHILENA